MLNVIIVIVAVVLLVALLWHVRMEATLRALGIKTALSALFIVAALVQPKPIPGYFVLLLIGLLLCLAGDVLLAVPEGRMFTAGLAAFLLGHVGYIGAFAYLTGFSGWLSWPILLVAAVSGAVFLWLRPKLGRMFGPVLAYVVVISVMVVGSWAAFQAQGSGPGGWFILCGAVLFYFSDLFVARDQFVSKGFINRVIGLPLYYAGQFLLAFSVGLIH